MLQIGSTRPDPFLARVSCSQYILGHIAKPSYDDYHKMGELYIHGQSGSSTSGYELFPPRVPSNTRNDLSLKVDTDEQGKVLYRQDRQRPSDLLLLDPKFFFKPVDFYC